MEKKEKKNDFLKNLGMIMKINRDIPAKQPFLFYWNFRDFVDKNSLAINPATMEIYSMMCVAISVFEMDIKAMDTDDKIDGAGFSLPVKGAPAYYKLGDEFPKDADNGGGDYNEEVSINLNKMLNKASKHIVELVGAYQVGGLRERNIESYFKMAKAEIPVTRIMQLVHFMSLELPKIVEEEAFQEGIPGVNWLVYHTAAASTQQLVNKYLEETKEIKQIKVSDDTKLAVKAALDAPWDKALIDAIPRKIVAHCYVYLEATKQLPDNWYQGIKAVNNMSTGERTKFRAFYRRYSELYAKVDVIDAGKTIADITKDIDVQF